MGILEVCSCVLLGIVGQGDAADQIVLARLTVDGDVALAALVLVNTHGYLLAAVFQHDGVFVSCLLLLFVVPELAVVNGAFVIEADVPVARLGVAPVRGEQLAGSGRGLLYAQQLPGTIFVTFRKVEALRVHRHWLKVEHDIHISVVGQISFLVRSHSVQALEGVLLAVGTKVRLRTDSHPILRTAGDVHKDARLVLGEFHSSDFQQGAEESFNLCVHFGAGLFPYHRFPFCLTC